MKRLFHVSFDTARTCFKCVKAGALVNFLTVRLQKCTYIGPEGGALFSVSGIQLQTKAGQPSGAFDAF